MKIAISIVQFRAIKSCVRLNSERSSCSLFQADLVMPIHSRVSSVRRSVSRTAYSTCTHYRNAYPTSLDLHADEWCLAVYKWMRLHVLKGCVALDFYRRGNSISASRKREIRREHEWRSAQPGSRHFGWDYSKAIIILVFFFNYPFKKKYILVIFGFMNIIMSIIE